MERRLAAILAADMVGYSRLMGADEEGTIARQREHREALIDPEIASHGGRIVKTMGDGLLVEFVSVVDAVKCAVAVQAGMAEREGEVPGDRRIQYRVGINLGDIVIDGDDILGDGVNVAARLEGLADPGGICISDVVHQSVEGKLDLAFADMGAQQVKNIARPVRAYRALLFGETGLADGGQSQPDKPSIAVLPFDNLSGDPEQEYFSDGMAEDLITDLSKISSLSVAARNSSFSFKSQMPDVKDVVEKLGVAFVLEGSVRKMGERLRINAQLIDGADGRHIWAERYDGDMAEIFEFQDDIRAQIVSALQVSLTPTDHALTQHKQTDSVEAYDLFLRGRANFHRFADEKYFYEAIECLETAIEIDPKFADAYGYLSYCYFYGWVLMLPEFDDNLEQANKIAERGVALDDKSAIALTRLGWIQAFLRRYDEAIANLERAIALAPNNAEVYSTFGQVLNFWGDPERGLEKLEKAFSIDTVVPPAWEFQVGHSHLLLRQYDKAIARLNRAVEGAPKLAVAHLYLACAYVELDRLDDASDAIQTALEIIPRCAVKDVSRIWPWRIDEHRNRILDGLRKAGLPEGDQPEDAPLPPPDKPSIAVLPFDNMSGDPEQEYFSDGMAEDLITDLSKISSLSVAARNSSFSFKGQMPDVKDVVEKLGVAFVLEGSVRKMGERLRINAQLIDGADGRHIWAERYDGDMANIFEFQDSIREQIVSALQVSLTPTDKAATERKPTDSVEAYDLFLKGRASFYLYSAERALEARKYLEQAIEIDPNFADAYGYLSYCHFYGWALMFPGFDDNLDRANELAERGAALDDKSAIALTRLGWIQAFLRRFDQATENFEKAIALAPDNAEVCAAFGCILNWLGDPERALEMLEQAYSLEAFAPPNWDYHVAHSQLLLGRYDQAISRTYRMVERSPTFTPCYLQLAWAYVELDRLDDARGAIRTVLELAPRYTLKKFVKTYPYRIDEVRDRYFDALRKAGLPEGDEPEAEQPTLPNKPSIAVLPFDNMSGDPEQAFFSDGLAEDIITALSKIERMRVIARNSTFAYKGQALDLRRIAEELGVRYVLEGSVRRGGERLRITAQLIDADDGSHLWAERYDRPVDDLFDVQDEITKEIVTALRVTLTDGETARVWARGTNNIAAWRYAVRASELAIRSSSSDYLEARTMAEKATELDPKYAHAWAILCFTYWFEARLGYTGDAGAKFARAAELAEHALTLDDSESWVIGLNAMVAASQGRYDEGVAMGRRGVELYPGNADVRAFFAFALLHAGNFGEAAEHFRAAMSLNPFCPNMYRGGLTRTLLCLNELDEALALTDEIAKSEPNSFLNWLFRAYILGQIGSATEAQQAVNEVRRLTPNLSLRDLPGILFVNDNAATQRFIEGLRKAGLPED